MNINKSVFAIHFVLVSFCWIFVTNAFADEDIECCLLSSPMITAAPTNVNAMIVYSKAPIDNYPFPSATLRNEIESRLSGLYSTISYGIHTITFKETTNNGDYFVSDFNRISIEITLTLQSTIILMECTMRKSSTR